MIFFFFQLGLQEIFFRNLPTPPPSKIKWTAPKEATMLGSLNVEFLVMERGREGDIHRDNTLD